MGWFGFGSSEGSSKEELKASAIPTRNDRKECWSSRDTYFQCLTNNGIIIPPGTDLYDGRGKPGVSESEYKNQLDSALDNDPCKSKRQPYEKHCARSWIEYFNKRHVFEERQKKMLAEGKFPAGVTPSPPRR